MSAVHSSSRPHPATIESACGGPIGVLSFAVLFAIRWPMRAKYLYDWDAAQYALGAVRFDVFAHRPHPPGYPLWIALVKLVALTGLDTNEAQIALGIAFASIAFAAFVALSRRIVSERTAWVLGVAMVFAPGAMLATSVASTYAVDLATSAVLGGLAARAWEGDKRSSVVSGVVAGVLLGVRASGVVLMGPLLLLAAARANRRDLAAWGRTVVAFVVPVFAWFVPVARMHGGARAFLSFVRSSGSAPFRDASVLYGATASAHAHMIRDALVWLLVDVAVVVALAAFAGRKKAEAEASFDGRAFYAAWLVPEAFLVLAVHAPKPGYLLLAVPPVLLMCARRVDRLLEASPRRALAAAVLVIAVDTVVATVPTRIGVLDRTSLASVRTADTETGAVLQATTAGSLPADTMILFLGGGWYGPNLRTLIAYLPTSTVWTFDAGKIVDSSATPLESPPTGELPRGLHRLVIVLPSDADPGIVTTAFPGTLPTFHGPHHQVLVWTAGTQTLAPTLHWNGDDYALLFGTPHGKLPHAWPVGFGDLEHDDKTEWIWASGPRSELSFAVPGDDPVTVTMVVGAMVAPEVKVTMEANGAPMGTRTVSQGNVITLRFAARRGINTVSLAFDRWNGHDAKLDSDDKRPLALSFDRVIVELRGVSYMLVPTVR